MTEEEAMNAYEDEEMFVVLPQTYDIKKTQSPLFLSLPKATKLQRIPK